MNRMFEAGLGFFMKCMHVMDNVIQKLIPSLHQHMQVRFLSMQLRDDLHRRHRRKATILLHQLPFR